MIDDIIAEVQNIKTKMNEQDNQIVDKIRLSLRAELLQLTQ